jgi:hypothetical protein
VADADLARQIAKSSQSVEDRIGRLEEHLETIELLLAALCLQGKDDSESAAVLYQKAAAKARVLR